MDLPVGHGKASEMSQHVVYQLWKKSLALEIGIRKYKCMLHWHDLEPGRVEPRVEVIVFDEFVPIPSQRQQELLDIHGTHIRHLGNRKLAGT